MKTKYFDFKRAVPVALIFVLIGWVLIGYGWCLSSQGFEAVCDGYENFHNEIAVMDAIERAQYYHDRADTLFNFMSHRYPMIAIIGIILSIFKWEKLKGEKTIEVEV